MKKRVTRLVRRRSSNQNTVYNTISTHFDADFYLKMYSDVLVSGLDPVQHYIQHGHDEGRDPCPDFSTTGYRTYYPDVVTAGMNAFFHYIQHGRVEGRVGKPQPASIAPEPNPPAPEPTPVAQVGQKPLSERLPSLDWAKASRLLGADALNMAPRARRVGITSILRGSDGDKEDGVRQVPEIDDMMSDGSALAEEMLAAARGKTLSLDLWDTILRRHCAPDAIKLRHARAQWLCRIDPEGPLGDLHPVDLLQLRRAAEADAADEHFEYRICDVADRLAPILAQPDEDFAENFLAQELMIEKAAISVDEVTGQLIDQHEGRKIVVSDFYMPGKALAELVEHAGLDGIDSVYSSSDHMATKRAGHLYGVVLDSEGLNCEDVLHIGDRFSADVAAARAQGIAAFHYHSPSHQPRLDRLDRDFWAHVAGDETVYAKGLAAVLGHKGDQSPGLEMLSVAVTGFVLHVLEQAMRQKVDKVFFFTREGAFFQRIYDLLVARDVFDIGAYPEAVLLEVSRRATFAASLEDFTLSGLMRLWSQYSSQSVTALATTLNIDIELWAGIATKLGLDPDETIEFPWKDPRFVAFVKHPRVAHIARESIWKQRTELLEYLEASGFEPRATKQRVIVDIGWRGTIQDNLACIVQGGVHGCYFGLWKFINEQAANVSKSGYVFDENRGYSLSLPEVAGLEFLFNAPGGSTIGYEDGEALREIVPDEEAIVEGPVAAMQERILEACGRVGDYARAHGLVSADILSFARELVTDFAQSPPSEVAEAFFQLSHNESFGVGGVHSMRFDAKGLGNLGRFDGSRLHSELSSRMRGLRWSSAAFQLHAFRDLERKLSPSQKLHLPGAPAIVRASSIGRPRIAVLSPVPIRGSGGHRTIFNFAAALSRRGHDVHLMHEAPADRATGEWIDSILGGASLTQHSNWLNYLTPAASIATIWYSAEFASRFWSDATNFYFVQDYEAMFNPMGDTYLRASQSYCSGFRHICVGRWLAHSLRTQFGVGVAWGGLGVDHAVYRPLRSVERRQKQVALLFQPEKFRRAPKLCTDALTIVKATMPEAEIVLYGSDKKPNLPFDYKHLGLITDVSKINELYNESAAGLCVSSTNPSRIPFEMMAVGCVPVDIYRYNNLFDYDAGTGLLAHEAPESIAKAVLRLLDDSAFCRRRSRNGEQSILTRSLEWEMDVAVNAVERGMQGLDFDQLDRVHPTYTDAPVIAEAWDSDPVHCFVAHQWAQALTGARPALMHGLNAHNSQQIFVENDAFGGDAQDRLSA